MKTTISVLVLMCSLTALSWPRTSSAVECTNLTRTGCLDSPNCILDQVPGNNSPVYDCRKPLNECESGFAKTGNCTAESGCKLIPQSCYCHCRNYGRTNVPDGDEIGACLCECAGGPPARCRKKNGVDAAHTSAPTAVEAAPPTASPEPTRAETPPALPQAVQEAPKTTRETQSPPQPRIARVVLPGIATTLNISISEDGVLCVPGWVPGGPGCDQFRGLKKCDEKQFLGVDIAHMGWCLEFQTSFSEEWVHVPIQLIHPWKTNRSVKADLQEIYKGTEIKLEQVDIDRFDFGRVHVWMTATYGSSHYFHVELTDKKAMVRIGPFAGTVMSAYIVDFSVSE